MSARTVLALVFVTSTFYSLRQLVRDWGSDGKIERDDAYTPILETLKRIYADVGIENRGMIKVLVPGAGLGRLAYEIAKEGRYFNVLNIVLISV